MVEWKFVDLAELQPQGTLETVKQEQDQRLLVWPAGGLQLTKSRKKAAAQEFEDPAWILYGAAYRDKAAATNIRKWFQIDAGLYNQVFTG